VKTCDETIAQKNDHLKREVKKQVKLQPTQDNRNNIVKKVEKKKNRTKDCFSTSKEASSK
jgi:hypothetical protein